MADHEALMAEFVEVTGAPAERAKFFLESANWTIDTALARYYEGDDVEPEEVIEDTDSEDAELPEVAIQRTAATAKKINKKPKPQSATNVVTLQSMADSSSDDEEEQGQAFYAGGSERSGQQVLGPPKKNPIKDYVSEIFRSAQESGAEVVDPHTRHQHAPGTSSSRPDSMYGGPGYRLGMTDDDHTVLPSARPARPQNIEPIVIKLWSDGLSINDGNLRPYDQPENREFLQSIKRGEIPLELRRSGGAPVHVDLEDHRNDEFQQPKKKIETFSGKGHTLGSPAPSVVVTETVLPTSEAAASSASPAATNTENEQKANNQLNTDEGLPTTMIQIRLADGSRLATRFNQSHTVDDIRRFISVARPAFEAQPFILLTTFPSKELTDGSMTIKDAGLLNAAIMQRLK